MGGGMDCAKLASMPNAPMSLEACEKLQGTQQAYNQAASDPSAQRPGDEQMTCSQITAELKQQQYTAQDKTKVAALDATTKEQQKIIKKEEAILAKRQAEAQTAVAAATAADTATEARNGRFGQRPRSPCGRKDSRRTGQGREGKGHERGSANHSENDQSDSRPRCGFWSAASVQSAPCALDAVGGLETLQGGRLKIARDPRAGRRVINAPTAANLQAVRRHWPSCARRRPLWKSPRSRVVSPVRCRPAQPGWARQWRAINMGVHAA